MALAHVKGAAQTAAQLYSELWQFVRSNTSYAVSGGNKVMNVKGQERYIVLDFNSNAEILGVLAKQAATAWNQANIGSTFNEYVYKATTCRVSYPLVSHHFFTDGNAVGVVLEIQTGVFAHLGFGMIDKFGTFNGGEFLMGTNWRDNYVNEEDVWNAYYATCAWVSGYAYSAGIGRCNVINIRDSHYILQGSGVAMNYPANGAIICNHYEVNNNVNKYNSRPNLYPLVYYQAQYKYENAFYDDKKPAFPIGHIPLVMVTSVENNQPEDILNNEWMVFPAVTKSTTFNGRRTGYRGFAYRIKT